MYNKFILENGITVVMEKIPYVKSVSIGFWIEAGSRYETVKNNGVSHFIEHMLFKGSKKRNAKEIAESIDSIGGQLNAFTGKECTCYYAKVLDNHLPIAIDVLGDMILNPKFQEEEIEKEKTVVMEEINMYEDSPEEIAHDLLAEALFNRHSLSYPILGKENTLKSFNKSIIMDYYNRFYVPDNIVVSIAGNFDIDTTLDLLTSYFKDWGLRHGKNQEFQKPEISQTLKGRYKDTEQLHLCIGMQGIPQGEDKLYPLLILNNIFGGSMSSRLFQSIREERGLAYSVYSYPTLYKDIGTFNIYVGLNPNQLENVSNIIIKEIEGIKEKKNITREEIYKSKEQLKGNYILGLESTSSRMSAMGKNQLLLNKVYTQREILQKIDSVKCEDIIYMADLVFNKEKINIAYVGKINDNKKVNDIIKKTYFRS